MFVEISRCHVHVRQFGYVEFWDFLRQHDAPGRGIVNNGV